MAVPEQTPYIEYTANGVVTGFALDFDCESKDHLIVTLDGVEPPVGSWSLTGGAVVFTTAPANGVLVVVHRNTPFSRTTDYQSYNNSFRPPVINKDFDWIWLKLQELGVADWILGNRISALKNYVDRKDDELKAYLMEEIRKQGVALDQLDEYYNYLMERLAQIAVDNGWDASFVVDGDENQHQINNTTVRNVESIADLIAINNPKDGQVIYVKSHHTGLNKGGGHFEYNSSKASINNGVTIFNGWARVSLEVMLRPEWAGCPCDGVNSDNDGLDILTVFAKSSDRAVFLGDSKLKLTRKWLIDFPIVLSAHGGFGYSGGNYVDVKHRGCVIHSTVANDFAIEVNPPEWRFGSSLENFTLLGDASGFGLRVRNIGWNSQVRNVTCDNFKGKNLSIGYIQDTHFYNVTCLRSLNTPENPALHFDADANYVYFHGCRFENANYLINTANAWQVHFNHCHFETGYYNGALGAVNEYRYKDAPCIKTSGRWVNFTNPTFVPIPTNVFKDEFGIAVNNVPYFIEWNSSISNMVNPVIINPSDNYLKGGVKFLLNTVQKCRNTIVGGTLSELESRVPAIVADDLVISSGCLLHFRRQDTPEFFGFAINTGGIHNCTLAKDADTATRNNGYLQYSYVQSGFSVSGNNYEIDNIYKYFNEACNVSEPIDRWHNFSGEVVLNMATIHPKAGLKTTVSGSTINNLIEVSQGREIPIFFSSGSGVIKTVPNWIIPNGANDFNVPPYSSHLFKRINDVIIQIS